MVTEWTQNTITVRQMKFHSTRAIRTLICFSMLGLFLETSRK